MFGFFKKPPTPPSIESLKALSDSALAEVKTKWAGFHQSIHLKSGVPLAAKMDMFSQPLLKLFQDKYPQLLTGGPELFWLTLFTAVLQSGTYPKEEVNRAIAQLKSKYGGTPK